MNNPNIICGKRIVYIEDNIFRLVQYFEFDNGWVIPIDYSFFMTDEQKYDLLVKEIEFRLKLIDPMQTEAFRAPEAMIDEDPSELDPFPYSFCQKCRECIHGI